MTHMCSSIQRVVRLSCLLACLILLCAALTNSMSGLNLVPTSVSGPRAGLGPSGSSSLLLPMSGDLNSLRLLSSLAFLHSSLKPEDSFKQVSV